MRMLYGHVHMWGAKMDEINDPTSGAIDEPLPARDINQKRDEDFVYFWA